MASNDPCARKRTCPKKIDGRNNDKKTETNNQERTSLLPGPGIYEPFLPPKNRKVEEYVPKATVSYPVKHNYVPKPIVIIPDRQKNKSVAPTFAPKENPERKRKKRDSCLPTALLPKDSLYWLPILNLTRKPTNRDRTFFYHTMSDGQRVKIYSYQSGQIDVYRKGILVNIRDPEN